MMMPFWTRPTLRFCFLVLQMMINTSFMEIYYMATRDLLSVKETYCFKEPVVNVH